MRQRQHLPYLGLLQYLGIGTFKHASSLLLAVQRVRTPGELACTEHHASKQRCARCSSFLHGQCFLLPPYAAGQLALQDAVQSVLTYCSKDYMPLSALCDMCANLMEALEPSVLAGAEQKGARCWH